MTRMLRGPNAFTSLMRAATSPTATGWDRSTTSPMKPANGWPRALSKLGYCSRSRAAELLAAGRVKWNGTVRRDPETPVRIGKDRIEIDGQPVERSSKIYLALN